MYTVSATLPRVESECDCSSPINNDSSSATGVGLYLGGVVTGALGVLLIVGIVGGACRLGMSKAKCVYKFYRIHLKFVHIATAKYFIHRSLTRLMGLAWIYSAYVSV